MRRVMLIALAAVFLLTGIAFAQDAATQAPPDTKDTIQQTEAQPAQEPAGEEAPMAVKVEEEEPASTEGDVVKTPPQPEKLHIKE